MMTPEQGEALTRIAEAGYQLVEISFSIRGMWTLRATHPAFGEVSQTGWTRWQAISALRGDVQRWDAWRPPAIEPPWRG